MEVVCDVDSVQGEFPLFSVPTSSTHQTPLESTTSILIITYRSSIFGFDIGSHGILVEHSLPLQVPITERERET
jgi:hypothetical protein